MGYSQIARTRQRDHIWAVKTQADTPFHTSTNSLYKPTALQLFVNNKLTVGQAVRNFPVVHRRRTSVNIITKACHRILSWASRVHPHSHTIPLRSTLIISSQLPYNLLPSGFLKCANYNISLLLHVVLNTLPITSYPLLKGNKFEQFLYRIQLCSVVLL